jgi:ADP-ribose pyrophosphatase
MKILQEKFLDSKLIFKGKVLTMNYDTVLLPNGVKATREIIKHPGAVAVVPLANDGRIVLVKQYRYPVGKEMLEIPAGKLDKGEKTDDCARRELSEETGYLAGELIKLTSIYTTPGFTDEVIHVYLAKNLTIAERHPDEDEFINVELYTKDQVKQMITNGIICDAKSMIGLFMAGI